MTRFAAILTLAGIALVVLFTKGCTTVPDLTGSVSDDFSTGSGYWEYRGDAYRSSDSGFVVLTEPENWSVGQILLDSAIHRPMTVEFDYRIGGSTSDGGDGMVMMFYRADYRGALSKGSTLGFQDSLDQAVNGYGIEFDGWWNVGDPSGGHIAIIRNYALNHLGWVDDPRIEDNRWHHVRVEIGAAQGAVYLDSSQNPLFNWTGALDLNAGRFGFSAATGSANNWHIIDNVTITLH